jgi:hypothetical protein
MKLLTNEVVGKLQMMTSNSTSLTEEVEEDEEEKSKGTSVRTFIR